MSLETKRLILRPWEESDASHLYQHASDPNVGPIAGWPPHTSIENSRQIIQNVFSKPETFAIVLKEAGLPVGCMALHFHSYLAEKDDEAELGYWVGRSYWGEGIATEAGKEMLRHAFLDLGLNRVWCGYLDGNDRSRRVQEKLGFKHQWTSDDVPLPQMGQTKIGHANLLTKSEWLANQQNQLSLNL